MPRAIVIAMLLFAGPRVAAGQTLSTLHIKVVLSDAEHKVTPVASHALLISDNPSTAAPRRIVTGPDGTADVKLHPGNHTVESDEPVAFNGKAYQWTQILDILSGHDAVLELTAANAEVGPLISATPTSTAPPRSNPSFLLHEWQDSVVAVWAPHTHGSGFVIDPRGLIATNQQVIGMATSVDVQLTPGIKVAASVLGTDPVRDVAVLWVDPDAVASIRSVPLRCGDPEAPSVADGQEIFTIGVSVRQVKDMASGAITRVDAHTIAADVRLERGSAGGPVFSADGSVIGITSVADEKDDRRRAAAKIVRSNEACDLIGAAEKKMAQAARPSATRLPVEPAARIPVDTLKSAAERRIGSLSPYQISSPTFDVTFFTPVLAYGALYLSDQAAGHSQSSRPTAAAARQMLMRSLTDFSNWSDYVGDFPSVLLVRITPRLVESFWTTVARGAAQTQGVSVPPIKHAKSAFSRMRAYCGTTEVTPIHAFMLERRVSEQDALYEGLNAFDPGAFRPACGSVKLVLYSDREPQKGETILVEPRVVQQIWDDFAPYRALNR